MQEQNTISSKDNDHAFHILDGRNNSYLFDPISMEIRCLTPEIAEALRAAQAKFSTGFTDYGSCSKKPALLFADHEYKPAYELNILLTANCNLHCQYCFTKDFYRSKAVLKNEHAKLLISFILDSYTLKFIKFFGGEPLLQFNKLKDIYYFTTSECSVRQQPIPSFGLVSNGLLLDLEKIKFFRDHGICVTVSCDGLSGSPNISEIRFGNELLAKKVQDRMKMALDMGLDISVQATYTKKHMDNRISPLDILEDFREFGVSCVHIMPAFNELNNINENDLEWLCDGFRRSGELSITSILNDRPVMLLYALKVISRFLGISEGHFICGAGIDSLTLMPSGELYPCYLLSTSTLKIADLNHERIEHLTTLLNAVRDDFVNKRKDYIEECTRCWARTLCASCFGPRFFRDNILGAPDFAFCGILCAAIEGVLSALADLHMVEENWKLFVDRLIAFLSESRQPILRPALELKSSGGKNIDARSR